MNAEAASNPMFEVFMRIDDAKVSFAVTGCRPNGAQSAFKLMLTSRHIGNALGPTAALHEMQRQPFFEL